MIISTYKFAPSRNNGQIFGIWLYTMREQYHARIATVALNQMEELYIPHKYVMQNIPGLRYMYLLFA